MQKEVNIDLLKHMLKIGTEKWDQIKTIKNSLVRDKDSFKTSMIFIAI
jgi:hypothetical protein